MKNLLRHNPLFERRCQDFTVRRYTPCISPSLKCHKNRPVNISAIIKPKSQLRLIRTDVGDKVNCSVVGNTVETLILETQVPSTTSAEYSYLDYIQCDIDCQVSCYVNRPEAQLQLGTIKGALVEAKKALGMDELGRLVFINTQVLVCLPSVFSIMAGDTVESSSGIYEIKSVNPAHNPRGELEFLECDVTQLFDPGARS